MKKLLLILLCLPMIGFGQNVNIPDANFKAYLVGNTAINTNGDTEIQVSEATAFNGDIYCQSMSIADLTGLEEFTLLSNLNCGNNQLTNLDVSQNTALTYLSCGYNQLTNLDVSTNTTLDVLTCFGNTLISLNLNNNNLYELDCRSNQLMELDLSNNTNLTHLESGNNPNLNCINVNDVAWSTANLSTYIDPQQYFSDNCSPSAIQEHTTNKELLKVTGILGRETKQTNQPLFYIYDDGTVEKRIVIE